MSTASKALLGQRRQALDGGGRVSGNFILRSAQQEEALHRIWYALRSVVDKDLVSDHKLCPSYND
ncbi:unnamed protein product [Spirodela intermedia]|uniref:Uncharacterized protein n=1 Tax=Spirodela intermedia TaxID=51605 RepID=A0A7I8IIK0_SPIIN|nr:unnamed protein product [Spirodela intermedia]CAA6657320.1 unnamed protein product [Spirodela intermedia]